MNDRPTPHQIRTATLPNGARVRFQYTDRPVPLGRCRVVLADETTHYPLTEGDPDALLRARWANYR